MRLSARLFGLIVLILLASAGFAPALPAAADLAGQWEGSINLPNAGLRIKIEFRRAGESWEGKIDIPQQGASGLSLKEIRFAGETLHFELQIPQGVVSFDGKLEGAKISGNMMQAGMSFPFTLERKAAPSAESAQTIPQGMIPRNLVFGNPERTSPQISPDGTKLAYLAPQNEVLNVWVRTIGKTDDQVITSDKKRGIRSFFWQFDGDHILYIQDKDGDENWHLYQTNLKSKMTRDLTPFDGVQAQIVATDPEFPDQMLVGINVRDRRLHDVYRVNLKNGALDLDTENPGDVAGWTADNDLQIRVAQIATPDGGFLVKVRDDPKAPWREFQRWTSEDGLANGVVGFTPDNRSVLVLSGAGANAARLLEVDLATRKSTLIAEDFQYDVASTMIHPKTNKLEAVQFLRERQEWKLIDKTLQADFDALKKVREGDFSVSSRDLADKTWLVAYVEDDAPVYFYAYDRSRKEATLLFSNRPKLEQYKLAAMKPISFKARDGLTIHGYLTLPNDVEPKNLPMVMLVHGGPWGRDTWGFNGLVQLLANRGYAVLQVNFRGSAGYGKAFLNAGDREWGAKMHDDLLDGKTWAIGQGFVNSKKICIMGGSYGGYATLVGLTFTPDEFACGVDIVGPSNLVTLLISIPPYWGPIKAIFDKRLGKLETEEEFLKSRSPLFKADRIKAPLLIGQGANDPRVKQAESDQIVAAMRKNNQPVEYVVFPDEGHGFARPENNLAFFAVVEQFLAKHLGGRTQPPTEAEAKLLASVRK